MKNFLFYVGGSRCGSTWLYHQLNSRVDCDMGPVKEWFLFHKQINLPVHSIIDRSKYFEYYQEQALNSEIALLGDITPINGGANTEQLRWFKEEMVFRQFNVLPLLTLRDPITRIVSQYIFFDRISKDVVLSEEGTKSLIEQSLAENGDVHQITAEKVVNRFKNYEYFSHDFIPTETIINNVGRFFKKIHVNFYETMFTEKSMKSLCNYLQIPYQPFDIDNKIFSFGSASLSDDDKMLIYESFPELRESYEYSAKQFGKDFIESIWWNPNK